MRSSSLLRSSTAWTRGCGLCLLALLILAPVAVVGQTQITTGVVQGTVTDQAGATLPGANVEVRNEETNLVKTISTDEEGRFVFLQLPPGNYTLTVSKQGFATLVQESFPLTVGQAISLNLDMKVSQVEERVTVSAIPTVDTVKTESSTTLNETSVSNLPVLGRKFEDLLTLTPGVSIVQGPDGDEISFAGQRGVFNNISLDGGDYNNGFFGEQAGGQRAAIDIPLDAVQEFQVVATGASPEFGRTAGGVINVITKSGTNEFHGNLFHFQRLEALTSNTSDGRPLTNFHREQFGGTIGGPIKRDRAFFFFAFEQIRENLTRANLSEQVGPTPCSVPTPTILANEALIDANTDCQRLALLNFFRTTRQQEEGLPIDRPIQNSAFLSKLDWNLTPSNKLAISYNFDHSRNENQTFDVATYGNSANGIEGPSKIHVINFNLFSTVSPTRVNEAHFTYSRESRPRSAVESNIPADTAMGFGTTFRFGHPFFLGPNVDELIWRTQLKDNFSIVTGNHTVKLGGEWVHTDNSQVFRGFFEGRYIFDSVTGFLRYASPAALGPGFGPNAGRCPNGAFVDIVTGACPTGTPATPLLLFLQGAGPNGPATDAAGASDIKNEDFALFIQDKWQLRSNFNLNYGLRWEAQIFPDPVVPPASTAYGIFLSDPRFPSDGTLHNQKKMFQPRVGFAWDISKKGKSVLRGSWGIYNARQNMLSQVGSITTNGVQQQTIAGGLFANPFVRPTWPGLVTPTAGACTVGTITNPFPCFSGVRVFSKDYANPRIYTTNIGFEQELAENLSLYLDFTHAKGVHLTRFLDYARTGFFAPFLGETMVASAVGKSLYKGFTVGMRKRFSRGYQFEWNYVFAKDQDDDSNERDPFTDRSFNFFNLQLDYALADRDIRHRFNFYTNADLPWGFEGNARIQAHTAQPKSPGCATRCANRNTLRKNNEFFSFDWRLQRPFRFGERYALIPIIEMFNTFNTNNNIDPTIGDPLFNFDGFLRQGVGDPRQVQLAIKFNF
ncbi:MAG TPA: carboxypeptidase regulatory-like domain-containing protein [Pyrinomonadaceae bacterium]|jgi:outer membrane receptor for ferrienterochelin and colicin|nr:carboxypeptidase regulatory-like domain-containing protein [Pyrinomonadaceae bacterium]